MPGCAAVGCNNRSEKGYIMKCFPRDPILRKIWQERVARADWEPSNNSFLCHVHFEADEWCIADNGRVRLKKDAVPSIFTVTSTRKSPKKRTKLRSTNKNECENEYTVIYLENDTEHSSTGHLEEKDSDSQDIHNPSIQPFIYRANHSPKDIENKQMSHILHTESASDLQREDVILISDDNIETQNIKECVTEKKEDEKDEQIINDSKLKENSIGNLDENVSIIKTEIKREIDLSSLNDSYDEIEQRLKEICDDYREETNSINMEKPISENQYEKEASRPLYKSINYKHSPQNEIGNMLTNNTDNIEIIFGTESGEECTRIPNCTSNDNDVSNKIDKLDPHITNANSIDNNKTIEKAISEDMEETLNKENVHVTPNMRAAMKRKRRTREEMMKSIKKSFCNESSQATCSISNSDSSDNNMEVRSEVENKLSMPESTQLRRYINTAAPITKFTVKVSGDPDDVFNIMQDFVKDKGDISIQEYKDVREETNTFVTSIITIDDSPMEDKSDDEDDDVFSSKVRSIVSRGDSQTSPYLSNSKDDRDVNRRLTSHSDEELNDLNANGNCLTMGIKSITQLSHSNNIINYERKKLIEKLKMQEDVIKKLTNELFSCKDIEKDLRTKYSVLEKKVESLVREFSTKTGNASPRKAKENVDMKQRLIDDLSSRLNHFEEANKKLVKNLTSESQQRKKFESQLKQRDNRIKELNWKLEKASKYLERAEKNTNTYRRKMLNMQTFIRRRKLLDDKMNRFNQLLIESVKRGYVNKTLSLDMAIEIKKTCGTGGYDRLLSHGFPLPLLSALRTFPNDNLSDSNESTNEILRTISSRRKSNEKCEYMKNEIEAETKDLGITESISNEIAADCTETITGTVQDIFEENNDVDDFSTNELTEHFISQLHTIM